MSDENNNILCVSIVRVNAKESTAKPVVESSRDGGEGNQLSIFWSSCVDVYADGNDQDG